MINKVIWEPSFYEFDTNEQKFIKHDIEQDANRSLEYDEEGEGMILDLDGLMMEAKRVMNTPMGLFSIDDALNPYKQYKFYMMHTNFRITESIEDILLEDIDGVEVLRILSPYRALIAFGKAFDASEVRLNITQTFTGTQTNSTEINVLIDNKKRELSQYPAWAIYVYPNGKIEEAFLKTDKSNKYEFDVQVRQLKECKELSNGVLIIND